MKILFPHVVQCLCKFHIGAPTTLVAARFTAFTVKTQPFTNPVHARAGVVDGKLMMDGAVSILGPSFKCSRRHRPTTRRGFAIKGLDESRMSPHVTHQRRLCFRLRFLGVSRFTSQ